MSDSLTIRSVLLRGVGAAVALGALVAPTAGAQGTTFTACYVPQVGAMYLIKRTGLPTACLATSHVEINWTEGGPLADGSVTTEKLAFDPATQAELDALASLLQSAGTINTGSNPVDWTRLKNVPAGFADGVDNEGAGGGTASDLVCVGCVGTADLAGAAVTTDKLAFDPATQAELDALSAAGTINAAANPVDWTKLKGVPTGIADGTDNDSGGDVTAVNAGTGLSGGGTSADVTLAVVFAGPGSAATVARSDHTHTTGNQNTAVGDLALTSNATGGNNTAVGAMALGRSTGSSNIALGSGAGVNLTSGSSNIYIGNAGVSSESDIIRIGSSHSETYIGGIRGVTTRVADAVTVLIDGNGQLGTVQSSRRVKEAIRDMGDASQGLLRLRPVTFRYTKPSADGTKPLQYGLIGEEVAEVYPELVAYDAAGEPTAVLYHMLPALLLNELQRQEGELVALRHALAAQAAALEEFRSALRSR